MTNKRVVPALMVAAVAAVVAACGGGGSSSSSSSSTPAATAGRGEYGSGRGSAGSGDFLNGGFPATETPVKGGRLTIAYDSNIDCWNGLSLLRHLVVVLLLHGARALRLPEHRRSSPTPTPCSPTLAADMPTVSADGLTYTVKLRPGLKFPDGSPVTAKDVKATFEYILDPNIQCATGGPPSSGYYNVIDGYDAYNTKAMTDSKGDGQPGHLGHQGRRRPRPTSFTLTEPDGSFLRALAMGWAFIRPASTPHKVTDTPPPFVGPYKITKYVSDKSLTIDREPTWAANVAAGVPEDAERGQHRRHRRRSGDAERHRHAEAEGQPARHRRRRHRRLRRPGHRAGPDQFKDRYFSTPRRRDRLRRLPHGQGAVRQPEAPPGRQLRGRPDAERRRSSAARSCASRGRSCCRRT